MICNMHCRLSCSTNNSTCSSFLFSQSNYTNTLKHRTCSPSSCHDQRPALRHHRRLEDPIINHASNYYVTNPCQTSSLQTLTISSSHRIHQKLEDKNIYCDLFNLLERPSPIKQKKQNSSNDSNSCRNHHHHHHQSITYKNIHAKIQDNNERKRHHRQQPICDKENKHRHHHQRHLSSKGFFRRVVRNYFCVPMTINNGEFSN